MLPIYVIEMFTVFDNVTVHFSVHVIYVHMCVWNTLPYHVLLCWTLLTSKRHLKLLNSFSLHLLSTIHLLIVVRRNTTPERRLNKPKLLVN